MDDLISRQAAIANMNKVIMFRTNPEWKDRVATYLKSLPSAQPLTEEDYTELHDRFGTYVEEVVRDMISGEGKRWKEKI